MTHFCSLCVKNNYTSLGVSHAFCKKIKACDALYALCSKIATLLSCDMLFVEKKEEDACNVRYVSKFQLLRRMMRSLAKLMHVMRSM